MTRSSRLVELKGEPFPRSKKRPDDSTVTVMVWHGDLFRADQKTVDTSHEWEETLLPNTVASFVTVGRTEGISHEHDLVRRVE